MDNGVVIDARFKPFGCGTAIVFSAMVTAMVKAMVKGKTIDKALQISN